MEFKKGDIVIVNGEHDGITFINAKGILLEDKLKYNTVGIEFDIKQNRMHSCGGKGKHGYCWNIYGDTVKFTKISEYKVKDNLTLSAIMDKNPCAHVCNAILCEVADMDDSFVYITQEIFENSKVMQDNTTWLLSYGFIKRVFTRS